MVENYNVLSWNSLTSDVGTVASDCGTVEHQMVEQWNSIISDG